MYLKISHTTEYHYDQPVQYALQRLRLTPVNLPGQTVRNWKRWWDGAAIEVSYDDQFRQPHASRQRRRRSNDPLRRGERRSRNGRPGRRIRRSTSPMYRCGSTPAKPR